MGEKHYLCVGLKHVNHEKTGKPYVRFVSGNALFGTGKAPGWRFHQQAFDRGGQRFNNIETDHRRSKADVAE